MSTSTDNNAYQELHIISSQFICARSKVGPKKLVEMSVIIYSQNLRGMSDSKEAELATRLKSKGVFDRV